MLSGLAGWAVRVMESAGYLGLIGMVALESIFPPIPSEVILPMGGFLTGQGRLNFGVAVAAATVGSVIGAMALYYLGLWLGEQRMRRFVQRRGKWILVSIQDYEKASDWFQRHGRMAVLLGRCAPGVRSYVSVPAGIQKMPLSQFLLFTVIGSGIYNTLLIGAGWLLGKNWERVGRFTGIFEAVLWTTLAGAITWWIVKKKRRRPESAGR